MTENDALSPRGWLSGWLVTLLTGLATSTLWGVATFLIRDDLFEHKFFGALYDLLFISLALITPIGVGVFLFAVILAAPSITVFSILLRFSCRIYRLNLLNRVITGLLFGTMTIVFMGILWGHQTASPAGRQATHPDVLFGFDIEELSVELSAVALAIVARPRWFGRS